MRISDSQECPINKGNIEIDSVKGSITLFIKSCEKHVKDEKLVIEKISNDDNLISLYCQGCLINNADIILFGTAKFKSRLLVLKSDGKNYKIIHEK